MIYDNLALLGLITGDGSGAKIFIKLALQKFPTDAKLWLFLAMSEYEGGERVSAKTTISKAYALSKDSTIVDVYKRIQNNQPLNLQLTPARL